MSNATIKSFRSCYLSSVGCDDWPL